MLIKAAPKEFESFWGLLFLVIIKQKSNKIRHNRTRKYFITKIMNMNNEQKIRSTTVLGVVRNGKTALGADGQVTLGNTIMKHSTAKIRKLYNGKVMVGFAGSTADAFTLLGRFESKLEAHSGNLKRAAIELAKDWRTDRYLRKLEAMMIAMDDRQGLLLSGTGDVIEADDNILAIGSGGPYALSAARALYNNTDMSAREIVEKGLNIAGEICIYTNTNLTIEEI